MYWNGVLIYHMLMIARNGLGAMFTYSFTEHLLANIINTFVPGLFQWEIDLIYNPIPREL